MIRIHASALPEIMGDPKTGDGLSVAAKSYLAAMAKEFSYSYIEVIRSKYMDKGVHCEQSAIDLYNMVFFTNHKKNKTRKNNEWITGECDILVPKKKVIDIKNAWSLATFPAANEEVTAIAKKSGYDWQGHAYMWLKDVDHIDPTLRLTHIFIERNKEVEEKIKHKVDLAREFLSNYAAQISLDHKHDEFKEAA